jgi:hypothetical protein
MLSYLTLFNDLNNCWRTNQQCQHIDTSIQQIITDKKTPYRLHPDRYCFAWYYDLLTGKISTDQFLLIGDIEGKTKIFDHPLKNYQGINSVSILKKDLEKKKKSDIVIVTDPIRGEYTIHHYPDYQRDIIILPFSQA